MKKSLSMKGLLAAGLVALLPSFANANVIGYAGSLAGGASVSNPFVVTDAGSFNFTTGSTFFHAAITSAGGLGLGYLSNFNLNLGLGNYIFTIYNISRNEGLYAAAISSHNGLVAAVPEPASLLLLGTGLLGLGLLRRRRQAA